MIQKDGSIIISDFQKGIAKSPVLGNGHIINADIFETEGLLKMNRKVEDESFFTYDIDSLPVATLRVTDGNIEGINHLTLLQNGRLVNNTGNAFSEYFNQAYDLIDFNGYFLMSGTVGDGSSSSIYIGQISLTGDGIFTFLGGAYAINGLSSKPINFCKGKDGYLYFTNGNKIGRIDSISIPSTVCVAVYSDNVLDLPTYETTISIVELGSKLAIGTEANQLNPKYKQQANIYMWDRTSPSFSFGVSIQENGINTMISKDNLIYLSAGLNGNIYISNGTSYRLLTTLKTTKKDRYGGTSYVYKNAIAINKQGRLLVGTSTFSDGTPNNSSYHGVWEIDISSGVNHLAYTIPSGEIGQNNRITIGYVESYNNDVYFGYYDQQNSNYNSCSSTFRLVSNTIFESPLFIVGDYGNKKTYNEIQWLFVNPLQDGQEIKIYYRFGLNDDWTLIYESTVYDVGEYSTTSPALISDAEVLQIKIDLLNTNLSTVDTAELARVLLK